MQQPDEKGTVEDYPKKSNGIEEVPSPTPIPDDPPPQEVPPGPEKIEVEESELPEESDLP